MDPSCRGKSTDRSQVLLFNFNQKVHYAGGMLLNERNEQVKTKELCIYGALGAFAGEFNQRNAGYGDVQADLKKDRFTNRTTYYIGNTLGNEHPEHGLCRHYLDASICSLNNQQIIRVQRGIEEDKINSLNDLLTAAKVSYIELQYHGGVRLEDIETFTFASHRQDRA